MTRNVMNAFTQAIGPEITKLYAQGDWPALTRLYDYSERLIFALIPIANIATLFLCPLLLTVWLHKPQLFLPGIYVLCAAVSIAMSAKEHKFQFQFSTNTHRELARFVFASYLVLVAVWLLVVPRFGIAGLLWAWLLAESVQVFSIMRLNLRFFAAHERLSPRYPVRMALLSLLALTVTAFALPHTTHLPLFEQAVMAIAAAAILLGLDLPLFHLFAVWTSLRSLVHRRLAAQHQL